jgi:CoA-transferase family III
MSFALDGVRVLELARFQAGPRGGMILSDLGAEVIKIERPGGEETRQHPPLVRGQSVYFSVYNRGKKSVCIDLRNPEGKELFGELVKKSDIVLENFRPGVMKAMGFEYERLRALNPGIIVISVSGFGQYGPYIDRPAFDPLGQAMSGLMALTGQPVGPSVPPPRWSIATPRYTRRSARWRPFAIANVPAKVKSSTCACSIPRSRWSRSRRRTIWRRAPKAARAVDRRIAPRMDGSSSARPGATWPRLSCAS